jgi:hypothetical protein
MNLTGARSAPPRSPAGCGGTRPPAGRRRAREKLSVVRSQVIRSVAVRVATVAGLVGALATGCGSGPSQLGAAVIVGPQVVPSGVVQTRLDEVLSRKELLDQLTAQGITVPDISRDIVTQSVIHALAQRAAQAQQIVVTDADIEAKITNLDRPEDFPGGLPLLRERIADEIVTERLAVKQVGGLAVTVDIVGTPSRTEAESTARTLAAGGAAAEKLFAENAETAQRAYEYRAATSPEAAISPVFGTAVGGSGWFQARPGEESWIAFRVVSRRTDAPPVAPELNAVSELGKSGLAEIGIRMLQPVADEAGVRVNPRYGVWDPVSMRVLAEDQIQGGLLAPRMG